MSSTRETRGAVGKTVLALLAVIAVVVGLTFYKHMNKPSLTVEQLQQMGTVVFETPRSFTINDLKDHNGNAFAGDRLEGGWTLAYFGYTFCPDICPITLSQLNNLDKKLKKDDSALAKKMHYVMVSVDPGRDSAEKLKGYVPHFNPDFVGVTGPMKNIHDLTVQLNIPYTPVTNPDDEYYLVDHGANLAIINPRGDYHGFIRPPLEPEKLSAILKAVDELYSH